MAQSPEATTGLKRGPGRPPKTASQPAPKRQKLAQAPEEQTPTRQIIFESPATQSAKTPGLSARVSHAAPLPTLPRPQSPELPDADWQSVPASGVLAASFERSRQSWTRDGVFQRFWTKPLKVRDGDKALYSSMKSKGKCRLRIEPHIFEVEVWVVERPAQRQALPPVQKAQPAKAPYGGQGQFTQQAYGQPSRPQGSTLPPIRQQQPLNGVQAQTAAQTLPAIQGRQAITPQPASRPTPPAADKKPSPDPVISMLANRASSDPELKGLMKEVATGNATQEQLKVFQKHIDELTAVIQARKAAEEKEAEQRKGTTQPKEIPQCDGAGDIPPPQQPIYHHQLPPTPKPYTPPPPPTPNEVVFAFTAPNATEDRFLFPQHSILEPLSAQHVLASFIVTRLGRDVPDAAALGLEADTEYWQPVTMMVEVAYGREQILKFVSAWVRPAEETRESMRKVMERCTRAPETFLAVRLPVKGTASAPESEQASKAGTPATFVEDKRKTKAKAGVATQKRPSLGKETPGAKGAVDTASTSKTGDAAAIKFSTATATATPAAATKDAPAAEAGAHGAAEGKNDDAEGARPRRTTRKSVRISEV